MVATKGIIRNCLWVLIFISLSSFATEVDEFIPEKTTKNGYVEPFQMFDDVFYVGDKWVSSYLIKTSAGLVLVDTLESPYGRWIPDNIRSLGLDPNEIKYIFITHGHSDHVGNAEYLQSKYGSKIVISYEDYLLAKELSAKSSGQALFKVPHVESFTKDGDEIVVGNTAFKFYLTPGHTKGCLSIDFFVTENGIRHRAFIVGGNGTNFSGSELAHRYVESVARIKAISQSEPVVEVNLANHPRMNQLFERKNRAVKGVNPFIDSKGFQDFVATLEARGAKKLQEEQAQ
ncbi:MBL fold metallo-hydrolase [Vibrio mangrovi]|uniref:MBL fold metallo-hydrolase n=1 Tax=Vibrio mangrovi TaxID=474394 RepID=A0A1Y6J1B7_9VIBR|nr:MBL fold metallo-hydrolase [Vibrio mangrovi]MDW6005446.1 MBL fold metallo-hydrolase [Vibrio mangrovi]SMS02113.1 Metallo-beta-lactamase L1 precursor [Vibrio mangrovi]